MEGTRPGATRDDELARALDEVDRHRGFITAIFDSIDVGLVLLDENGSYLTVNRRHEQLLRLAYPDGHAGRAGQLGEVFAEDGERRLAGHEMPALRAAAGEEFEDVRMWIGSDPLTRRALSVSARAVRDPDGRFQGAALAYKDVTDYLRAMQVKDQFVAAVSHEFRTPLTSIHGYLDLVLRDDEGLPPGAVFKLGVVRRNTERLHRLVSDLLLSASVDGLRLDRVRSDVDVSELVQAAIDSARPLATRAGVTLDGDLPAVLRLRTDPERFSQVVDNLVSNAVKYTLRGGWVRVTLAEQDHHVQLTVADNGIGIGGDDRDRLFSRFFRSSEAEERSIQGVGLGLSIVKQIVEAHGGQVLVDSAPGRGSTFRVLLPIEPAQGARGHVTAPPVAV